MAAHVLGPAYEQLRELVARFGAPLRGAQGRALGARLRGPAAARRSSCCARPSPCGSATASSSPISWSTSSRTRTASSCGLIEQLRGPETRLFLVGDEFQSIYGFRHADVEVYRRAAPPVRGGRRAERRGAAADRQLPRGARAGRPRPTRSGAACSHGFEPLDRRLVEEPEPGRAAGRAPAHRRRPQGMGGRGDRAAAARGRPELGIEGGGGAAPGGPAPGARRRRRGPRRDRRPAAGLHPRRRVRDALWPTPGSTPTSSAAAASGPSSRSRTCAACWR